MKNSIFHLVLTYRDDRILTEKSLNDYKEFLRKLYSKYPDVETYSDIDITLDGFTYFHVFLNVDVGFNDIHEIWPHGHIKLSRLIPDIIKKT